MIQSQYQKNNTLQITSLNSKLEESQNTQIGFLDTTSQEISRERCITSAEFRQVVDYACMLQKLDVERETNQQKTLEAFAQFDPERGIPLSVVSKVVDDVMHIGKPYVEQALTLYFPSKEQIEQDLQRFNVVPTFDYICKDYETEIKRAFAEKIPGKKIGFPRGFFGNIFLVEEDRKTYRLGPLKLSRKRNVSECIAKFSGYHGCMIFYLFNPIFLRVCGNALDKLNKKYSNFLKATYNFNYPIKN